MQTINWTAPTSVMPLVKDSDSIILQDLAISDSIFLQDLAISQLLTYTPNH